MKRVRFISLFALTLVLGASAATVVIPGPLARHASAGVTVFDTLETYSDGAILNGLNGGSGFIGAYVDNGPGIVGVDDSESYSDGAALDGLNGGNGFTLAYADRVGLLGVKASDDMESYSDGAALDALNGGSGWSGAFADR